MKRIIMGIILSSIGVLGFFSTTSAVSLWSNSNQAATSCYHFGNTAVTDCLSASNVTGIHYNPITVQFSLPVGTAISQITLLVGNNTVHANDGALYFDFYSCDSTSVDYNVPSNITNHCQSLNTTGHQWQAFESQFYNTKGGQTYDIMDQVTNQYHTVVLSKRTEDVIYILRLTAIWSYSADYSVAITDITHEPATILGNSLGGFNIMYPEYNRQLLHSPFIAWGDCYQDVTYAVDSYATSTQSYSGSITCTGDGKWSTSVTGIPGSYDLTVISDGHTLSRHFIIVGEGTGIPDSGGIHSPPADYPTCTPLVNWSCNFFSGDACKTVGNIVNSSACLISDSLYGTWNKVTSTPPYTYIYETYQAIQTGMTDPGKRTFNAGLFNADYSESLKTDLHNPNIQNHLTNTNVPAATSTINFSTDVFGTKVELFNSSSTPAVVGMDVWNKMRPYEDLIIYLGTAAYLVFRFLPI